MMTPEQIEKLIHKCLNGEASDEEERMLNSYLEQLGQKDLPIADEHLEQMQERSWNKLENHFEEEELPRYRWNSSWGWKTAAAAIVVVFAIGALLFKSPKTDVAMRLAEHPETDTVIYPATDKAYLLLSNGEQIALGAAEEAQQKVIRILDSDVSVDKGQISFGNRGGGNEISSQYQTLVVPAGTTYKLMLSDGTKIWMNAASKLKFPAGFEGHQRFVEMEGEAYFEVAKDKDRPFIIRSRRQEIKVLGTSFNLSDFDDEKDCRTTLVEGAVEVTERASKRQLKMKAGEQTLVGTQFKKIKVDPSAYVAWKNGYFDFTESNSLVDIMKQIARWYNVKVVFKNPKEDRMWSGKMKRNMTLNEIVGQLNFAGINCELTSHKSIRELTIK